MPVGRKAGTDRSPQPRAATGDYGCSAHDHTPAFPGAPCM
jgi:hypothetical protein